MRSLVKSTGAKITAVVLFLLLSVTFLFSVYGTAYMTVYGFFSHSSEENRENVLREITEQYAYDAYQYICSLIDPQSWDDGVRAFYENRLSEENSNFFFRVYDENNKLIAWNYWDDNHMYSDEYYFDIADEEGVYQTYTFSVYVRSQLSADDQYSLRIPYIDFMDQNKYSILIAAFAQLGILFLLLIFIMCGAGRKTGNSSVHLWYSDKIPLELFTGAVFLGLALICTCLAELPYQDSAYHVEFLLLFFCIIAFGIEPLLLYFLTSLARRVKNGKWWRNSLIYMVFSLCCRFIRRIIRGISYAVHNLPLYWKAGLIWGGICLFEFVVFMYALNSYNGSLFFWFLEKMMLTPVIIYGVIGMRKLQKGGEEMAQGNFSYITDTSRMPYSFQKHGENLNSINESLQKAVDERMKSERLKTELITNVSHDIKTPITSIINYVDLMKKEEIQNETAKGYLDVLERQSQRLKKLTEDLVEVSKASTGNIQVNMEPMDINVLLMQATAEFEERLNAKSLQVVLSTPPEPVMVTADGRLMWRVFDNLLSNICKYALEGTRVYISAEEAEQTVLVTFKNISKYSLNISSDELMERFVRGDSSRNTEGSGLGLSIAQSLTKLQKGTLNLTIDGDLFKATVTMQRHFET